MASGPIRDPKTDDLLTPQNSALVVIDYQPLQVNSIASMDRNLLVNHIVAVAKTGVGFRLPIVHSTVNVKTGWNKPPIAPLRKVLEEYPTHDRTSINAWEDVEFRKAVEGTKRKKIIMTALWTEACLIMPTLDMLKEGYEIYVVADAVGGTSPEAHEMALRRIQQAGGRMTSVTAMICELQRDWNRGDTVQLMIELFLAAGGTPGLQMSYDFVSTRTHDGRSVRVLNLIDEYTRECLLIRAERRWTSAKVIEALADVMVERGVPAHLRSDNGPEFVAKDLRQWLINTGAKTLYIEPGSPWENGYCESFNSKLRDEFLN